MIIEQPPRLKIDDILYPNEKHLPVRRKIEKRVVWNLLQTLEQNSFLIHSVDDGEELVPVKNITEAMELIFNLDDCWVFFLDKTYTKHAVRFVFGNGYGVDCINDWSVSEYNTAFDKILESFEPESCV